jgi:D-alanine--poly(phosphoribitol) ligase subunit 1
METNYHYNLGLLFTEVATANKKNVAIKEIDNEHSYETLNNVSNKLVHFLLELEINQNDVVAIFNNKSLYSYSLMLACSKIGAIYTNLDPKSPGERLSKMLKTCSPKILFYSSYDHTSPEKSSLGNIKLIDYLDIASKIENQSSSLSEVCGSIPSNAPAYIMFTSGSTGFPKGVVISHQNILNFIQWSQNTYQTATTDVFTNINPMHFDNSVFDFYSSLYTGASIIPINESLTVNPRKLIERLNQLKPTIWFSVPSMLVYALNMRALRDSDLPSLKTVTFGGEGFPKNQLKKLWKLWGESVRFVNVYGPTECTCICSSYDVSQKDLENDELLPLGPMATNFYHVILDENEEEVKQGEIGELHIGGPNVGIGYYNNQSKTKEAFSQNPAQESYPDIIYKSGDLVRQAPNSNLLFFSGRKDNQIKRMGYRIELEEIENALNSFDFIKESAVIYVDTEKHPSQIIGCIKSDYYDSENITNLLKNLIPLYMVPDKYFKLDKLPKNQNGKIDRLKLKKKYIIEN